MLDMLSCGEDAHAIPEMHLAQLEAMFPDKFKPGGNDLRKLLIDTFKTSWHLEDWIKTGYSYLPPGVDPSIRSALRQPLGGRLFFAGEALSDNDSSTVHGAIDTGIAAAQGIRAHRSDVTTRTSAEACSQWQGSPVLSSVS